MADDKTEQEQVVGEEAEWLARVLLFCEYNFEGSGDIILARKDLRDALNNIAQGAHVPRMLSDLCCWCGAKHRSIEDLG